MCQMLTPRNAIYTFASQSVVLDCNMHVDGALTPAVRGRLAGHHNDQRFTPHIFQKHTATIFLLH